jgi:hypothetical protein
VPRCMCIDQILTAWLFNRSDRIALGVKLTWRQPYSWRQERGDAGGDSSAVASVAIDGPNL